MTRKFSIYLCVLGLAAVLPPKTLHAEDFYKGKSIKLLIGYGVGGGYDLFARHLARHYGRNIPGEPNVISQNMPGAGSMRMANYLYNLAPKDGTVLGAMGQALPMSQLLKYKGIEFDVNKMAWIGNPSVANGVTSVWYKTGVKTIEDIKKREVIVPATGGRSTSTLVPRLMNAFLGTKFKIIQGFAGAGQMNLAIERGEVEGRGSNSIESWYATKLDWINEKKIIHVVQLGLTKDDRIPDVPLIQDLASNPDDAKVLKVLSISTAIGRPIAAPPGLPPVRVRMLRDAFDATMKDKGYLAEAKQQGMRVTPMSGAELEKLVTEVTETPQSVAKKFKLAMKFGRTYKCAEVTKDPTACAKPKKKKK